MRIPRSIALLAAVVPTHAVSDSSPFFLLSTEKSQTLPSRQITTASHLEDSLVSALSKCDSHLYFFVSYPGLHTADLRRSDAMPELQKRLKNPDYKSTVQIAQVLGETDMARVAHSVSRNCRVEEYNPQDGMPDDANKAIFGPTTFTALTSDPKHPEQRRQRLDSQDALFDAQLRNLVANHTRHTIVLVGLPASPETTWQWEQENEPPFESRMHTDLKRDVDTGFKRRQAASKNPQHGLPMFEKYQFLTPGIFMALTVSLLLFLILYVAITAIAALEVSYMSFAKEMGPSAQNKQQ